MTLPHSPSTPALHHAPWMLNGAQHRIACWQWGDAQAPHVLVCVHGLSRQGRDFDGLAQALIQQADAQGHAPLRIICPDMPGRGQSDWLPQAADYQVPTYVQATLQLLLHVHQQAPIARLDWLGTSMGGLVGLGVAAASQTGHWPLPVGLSRMVFNDVGPALAVDAIHRIGKYVGNTGHYASKAEAFADLRQRLAGFGPHTDEQWQQLNRPMLRPHPQGGWQLHYDPKIAHAFQQAANPAALQAAEQALWQIYDAIRAKVLILRGAESDLLTAQTAQAMQQRHPQAQLVQFAGVGHAPTLLAPEQTQAVGNFLLAD